MSDSATPETVGSGGQDRVTDSAAVCDCGHGLLPPPWHHDNCPVLLAWLMKNIPEGEAEIAESPDLRSLRGSDGT